MNNIKKIGGLIWMSLAIVAILMLFKQAATEFAQNPSLDTRMFWYTIIPIFLPIVVGLVVFGWYAFKGEYGGL
jgi:hypothetical protein